MTNRRWRPVILCAIGVIVIWAVALTGYRIAKNSRMTAEKLQAYMQGIDLAKLTGEARAKAIRGLADRLNAMSMEERRRARLGRLPWEWFDQMTEEEKAGFIDATMPTGFKQMLTSFEELPDDKRKRAIDDAMRQLKEAQTKMAAGEGMPQGTNGPPLSP